MAEVRVGEVGDFEVNEPARVEADVGPLCVIRTVDGVRVLSDTCTHQTASLSDGEYYDDTDEIECPLHASTFACSTGAPSEPPATVPVRVYPSRVVDGALVIDV